MALCGDKDGIFKMPLKQSLMLFQKLTVTEQLVKRWIIVSLYYSQKGHNFVSTFLKR